MRVGEVAAWAAAFLPALAFAEAGPRLSETSFLAFFESGHPALVAERRELLEAEAEAAAARVFEVPELQLVREAPGRVEQLDFGVAWQPPHPERRRLAVQAAEARIAAARSRFEARAAALHQELRAVYANWSIGTARVAALDRWVEELGGLAERERRRAALGESSGLDARRLALAAVEAQARLARSEAEKLEAFAAVRGLQPRIEEGIAPALPVLPEPATVALASHPELVALEAELAAATAEREMARLVLEVPEVGAGWQRQESDGDTAEGLTLAVRWALPLASRRERPRALAEAAVTTTTGRLEVLRPKLEVLALGAEASYRTLRQAALDGASAVADNQALLDAARAAFDAGEADVTDLLDALRSMLEAELAVLDLHQEAAAAHRSLQLVSGATAP